MTKLLLRIAIVFAAGALAAGGYFVWQSLPEDEQRFALAEVQRGDLVVKTYLRGELRAVRSLTLTAPNIGTQSQITQLAPMGALATRGDLIFELDDSERVAALEDSLLTVEQIQENLRKAEAELEIRKSQDEVEIVQANFQVRRAELEVQRNELLADIDARKNELTLEEARRRKQKLEADIENRLKQRESELAVLREQLNKAQLDVDRDKRRIAQSRVLAPLTGLVAILQNRSGGRGGFGQSLPEIREGDQIPAGMSVTEAARWLGAKYRRPKALPARAGSTSRYHAPTHDRKGRAEHPCLARRHDPIGNCRLEDEHGQPCAATRNFADALTRPVTYRDPKRILPDSREVGS